MRESQQSEIELKDTTIDAFKALLKYIYTSHMSLSSLKVKFVSGFFFCIFSSPTKNNLLSKHFFLDCQIKVSLIPESPYL